MVGGKRDRRISAWVHNHLKQSAFAIKISNNTCSYVRGSHNVTTSHRGLNVQENKGILLQSNAFPIRGAVCEAVQVLSQARFYPSHPPRTPRMRPCPSSTNKFHQSGSKGGSARQYLDQFCVSGCEQLALQVTMLGELVVQRDIHLNAMRNRQ